MNTAAAVAAELFAWRSVAWDAAWLVRLAAAVAIAGQTVVAFLVIGGTDTPRAMLVTTVVTCAGGLWLFRYRRIDVVVLGTGALSAIAIVMYFVGRHLLEVRRAESSLLLLALLLIGLSAAAAVWLNRLARRARADAP